MSKMLAFGNHKKEDVWNLSDTFVYPCILCDQPTYFSKFGGVNSDDPTQTVSNPSKVDIVFGKECFTQIAKEFLETSTKMVRPKMS